MFMIALAGHCATDAALPVTKPSRRLPKLGVLGRPLLINERIAGRHWQTSVTIVRIYPGSYFCLESY